MTGKEAYESILSGQISEIRQFNRFYTARLGLLRRRHLDGEFSLTEARILYEVGAHPLTTATTLRATLELDRGYISRLVSSLERRRFLKQTLSKADGREKHLTLTVSGERAVARINDQSQTQVGQMIATISATDRLTLVASLQRVCEILSTKRTMSVRIERLKSPDAAALQILKEYYEAVHVVQRDKPQSIRRMIAEPGSGMWLAYLEERVVGCVILRRLESIPFAGECKRLYIRPEARGNRLADKLLDAQEEFARAQGLKWIYLDSYHDLKAAIAVYKRRGYRRCARYNDNPQATLFMRKKIA